MTAWLLFVAACLVSGLIAGFLVKHDDYPDGIVGRFALGIGVVVPCGIIVLEALVAYLHEVVSITAYMSPAVTWVVWGLTIFLARHARRWWLFHTRGVHPWVSEREQKRAPNAALSK